MRTTEVAVVGAGPAGMAAALAAAEAGARVTLVDEARYPGGQFFKRAPATFGVDRAWLGREHEPGQRLIRAVSDGRVELLTDSLVWGVFDDRALMLYRGERSEALRAGAIVLATGAYDRPVPFPGWTLPGVMTAGAAQTLAKAQWVRPGRRVLLAGAGPFLLPVAQQLVWSGARIVGLYEATGPGDWWRGAGALWGQWSRSAEAWGYWRTIHSARVGVRFRHKVLSAVGAGAVEAVTVCRVDRDWRTVPGTERVVEADALAIGYGFLPSTELAELSGCALRWDEPAGGFFVACDERMATSRAGVFAAGEITRIGGAALALEEGRLAGLGAAEHLGCLPAARAETLRRGSAARLAGLRRFAAMLNRVFTPRPGLWEGLTGATVVCRCEEVTAGEIRERIRAGCTTPKQLKDRTRAGMGLCQGRVCRAAVTRLIVEETGCKPADVPRPSIRPPIKPVPLEALAQTEEP